jgi:hypothetical protein
LRREGEEPRSRTYVFYSRTCYAINMKVTASRLRENIYSILDQVAETGVPVEIERKGRILRIVADQKPSKLDRLKKRSLIVGNPDDLTHMDWSTEWSELK